MSLTVLNRDLHIKMGGSQTLGLGPPIGLTLLTGDTCSLYCAILCVSVVFPIVQCLSIYLSICFVGVLYPHG